jgi:beta-glucanase (GH16 family)
MEVMKQTKTTVVTIFHIHIKIVLETEESISWQLTHTHVDELTNKKYHKRQN